MPLPGARARIDSSSGRAQAGAEAGRAVVDLVGVGAEPHCYSFAHSEIVACAHCHRSAWFYPTEVTIGEQGYIVGVRVGLLIAELATNH